MSLRDIDKALRRRPPSRAPKDLRVRCLATIPAPTKGETDMQNVHPFPGVARRGLTRSVLRLALTGALATALAIGFLVWNSATSRPTLAAAIHAFAGGTGWKTWHLKERTPDGTVTETWRRLPDAVRTEIRRSGALIELRVQRGGQGWIYLPQRKQAFHSRVPVEYQDPTGDNLRELKRLERQAQAVGGLKVTERRERGARGRVLRVMEVEIESAKHYGQDPSRPDPRIMRLEVTLDAETGRLEKHKNAQSGYSIETLAYDEPMPDSLFEWRPPAGVRVTRIGDWWGERLPRTVAAAENERWKLRIHAVDLAANGEIWLTASWHWADETYNTWGTMPLPMTVKDERGRVYVSFMGLGGSGPTQMVNGYTPVKPRRPGDTYPTRVTGSIGDRTIDLPVPAPASWSFPPKDPRTVAHPEEQRSFQSENREWARRQYRERQARGEE